MELVIKRRPVAVPVLPVITIAILVFGAFLSMRIGRIQGSEIGVLLNNVTGNIEVRTEPGALVYNGFLSDFWVIDNSIQTIRMVEAEGVNIKTMDGADVTLDVEINYRLLQDAKVLRDRVVPECGVDKVQAPVTSLARNGQRQVRYELVDAYKSKWMRDFARSVIRYKFGELKTVAFYDAAERSTKAVDAVTEFNRLLNPHGLEILQVVPDKHRFYEEYENKIKEKKAADQETQSQREKARAALEDQARQEAEATAQVNIEISAARGDLRKDMLAAEAAANKAVTASEAYAYETRTRAEADLFQAKNQGRSVLAQAEATAQGIRQLAMALAGEGASNLVRLAYAKALGQAQISGVPYARDPIVQKVDVTNTPAAASKGGAK